jgi:hypothetical protein
MSPSQCLSRRRTYQRLCNEIRVLEAKAQARRLAAAQHTAHWITDIPRSSAGLSGEHAAHGRIASNHVSSGLSMYSRADAYRLRGFQAQQQAAQATEDKTRDAFEIVAEGWFELAEMAERLDILEQQADRLAHRRFVRQEDGATPSHRSTMAQRASPRMIAIVGLLIGLLLAPITAFLAAWLAF